MCLPCSFGNALSSSISQSLLLETMVCLQDARCFSQGLAPVIFDFSVNPFTLLHTPRVREKKGEEKESKRKQEKEVESKRRKKEGREGEKKVREEGREGC